MMDIEQDCDGDLDDNEDKENINKVLSVYFDGAKIGIAFYDELSSTLHVSSTCDVSKDDVDHYLNKLKEVCQPSIILIQSKTVTNKPLLEIICRRYDGYNEDKYSFLVIKNKFWRYDNAVGDMIQNLSVQSYRPDFRINIKEMSYQANMLRLASSLDMENRQLVSAVGALIQHLRAEIFALDGGHIRVADVQTLRVDEYVRIDSGTFQSLQIFCEDEHPLLFKEKGRSKEGFSLFSILDRTVSLPGRRRLRSWLSSPNYCQAKILDRQDGVELVSRVKNADFVSRIAKLLRHTHDIPKTLLRIKKANASHSDWIKLMQTLNSAVSIFEYILFFVDQPLSDDCAARDQLYLQNLTSTLNIQVISNLCNTLCLAIDLLETKEKKQVTVRPGFDEVLDSLRSIYDHLDDKLAQVAKDILQQAPLLSHISVEYLPQIGYLIAIQEKERHFLPKNTSDKVIRDESPLAHSDVPQPHCTQDDGTFCENYFNSNISSGHIPTESYPLDYQHIYSSEGIMYFKHPVVQDLDHTIGDIHSKVSDRQKEVLLDVEGEVLECEYHLMCLAVILESLDAVISLGRLAKERNYKRPEIVEDQVVIVKAGRHPLQELTVENFIPNDIFLSPEKHIGVITGVNGSGKSVYLKQVGLLVFLAHIGSFLPCERAVIGLCDRILTCVPSVESCNYPLSAFMLDLSQLKHMHSTCTTSSLCLIDEFGKGTAPIDGMALLAATIAHFNRKSSTRVLISTNFLEIFQDDVLEIARNPSISTFKMDVYENRKMGSEKTGRHHSANPEHEQVFDSSMEEVPLFKLKIGTATSAGGLACARRADIDNIVLERATALKKCFVDNEVITDHMNMATKNCQRIAISSIIEKNRSGDSMSNITDSELEVLQLFLSLNWNEEIGAEVVLSLLNKVLQLSIYD